MKTRLKSKRGPNRVGGPHLAVALLAILGIILLVALAPELPTYEPTSTLSGPNSPQAGVQFSLPSGYYEGALTVELSSPDPDAAIYFTTDGSIPTPETGTLYTDPIHFPSGQPRTAVLRARAVPSDGEPGAVQSATYFLNIDTDIPLVSLIIDPQDLWDEESGIYAKPHKRGRDWERAADFFFYDPQQEEVAPIGAIHAPAGARIHGVGSRSYDKKSLRLYFRDEYGLPTLEFPLFPDATADAPQHFEQIVIHDGGQDFPAVSTNGTLIRNHLVGNLVREAGGYATYTRPALVFINGQLWGVYNIRERINEDYLAQDFQIDDADILGGFENSLRASSGDREHWKHLMEYMKVHDLSDEDNYAYVQTQMNVDNFIDYVAIQIITANADWPHNNQLKFRDRDSGRWHWMFWDSDYSFGLISAIYIEKDMYERALDPEGERGQLSSMMLNKLFENPQFKHQFLTRLADLLNTVFTSQNMLDEIDQLASGLEAEISYETQRWPGSGDWEAGVEYMREFARQRPDILRSQTVETFDLPGTALLTLNRPGSAPSEDGGSGSISINGGPPLTSQDLPWQGTYFQDVDINLLALPDPGYQFAGWTCTEAASPELAEGAEGACPELLGVSAKRPELTLPVSGDLALTPHFVRSEEKGVVPGSVEFTAYGRDGESSPVEGLEGDWITLQVRAPGGVDLRGWRITDNDSLTAQDEGSLILADYPALTNVPLGTTILLVPTETPLNDQLFTEDDLSSLDGQLVLYAGNSILDADSDSWFALGDNDTLVLLAPGATAAWEDDQAIDFRAIGDGTPALSPADFGLPETTR